MILTKQMRLDRVMLLQILRRKRTYIETIKYFFTEMYLQWYKNCYVEQDRRNGALTTRLLYASYMYRGV